MTTVKDIYDLLDTIAPFENADSFDNVGILIGNPQQQVTGVLVTLDLTAETINEAVELGYNTIVTHHPIIFNPPKTILSTDLIYKTIKHDLSVISAHTNLDKATAGVSYVLASTLGLENIRPIDYLPEGSNHIGYGCIGELKPPMSSDDLALHVKKSLAAQSVTYNSHNNVINKVAVYGGSGGSFLGKAIAAGAQCVVTGDVKHDVFLSAKASGVTLVDAGHFATEALIVPQLVQVLRENFTDVKIQASRNNLSVTKTI